MSDVRYAWEEGSRKIIRKTESVITIIDLDTVGVQIDNIRTEILSMTSSCPDEARIRTAIGNLLKTEKPLPEILEELETAVGQVQSCESSIRGLKHRLQAMISHRDDTLASVEE